MCCISKDVMRNGPSSNTSRLRGAEVVRLGHHVPPVLGDEVRGDVGEPARRPERQPGRAEVAVVPRVERRDDVDEVVRMAVGDQHRADVVHADDLLESRERPGPGVDPQVVPVVRHEVAAVLAARPGPGALRAQDRQLHAPSRLTCSTPRSRTSGPRKTSASRWNRAVPRRQESVGGRTLVRRQEPSGHELTVHVLRGLFRRGHERRRGRARAGQPDSSGSGCIRGRGCRSRRSMSGSRYPRAAARAHPSWCPSLDVLDEHGTRGGWSVTAEPIARW